MGAAALPIAAVGLAAASTGAQIYGEYQQSRGVAAGDVYRSEELKRAAEYGDLQATQVNAQMTRNLTISLGKLDTIRAAAHTDPSSPSAAAVRDYTEQVGTEEKQIRVASIEAQARQSEADAAYERFASQQALLSGDISMFGTAVGGLGGAVQSAYNPFGTRTSTPAGVAPV